jgi:hypothetical protein
MSAKEPDTDIKSDFIFLSCGVLVHLSHFWLTFALPLVTLVLKIIFYSL